MQLYVLRTIYTQALLLMKKTSNAQFAFSLSFFLLFFPIIDLGVCWHIIGNDGIDVCPSVHLILPGFSLRFYHVFVIITFFHIKWFQHCPSSTHSVCVCVCVCAISCVPFALLCHPPPHSHLHSQKFSSIHCVILWMVVSDGHSHHRRQCPHPADDNKWVNEWMAGGLSLCFFKHRFFCFFRMRPSNLLFYIFMMMLLLLLPLYIHSLIHFLSFSFRRFPHPSFCLAHPFIGTSFADWPLWVALEVDDDGGNPIMLWNVSFLTDCWMNGWKHLEEGREMDGHPIEGQATFTPSNPSIIHLPIHFLHFKAHLVIQAPLVHPSFISSFFKKCKILKILEYNGSGGTAASIIHSINQSFIPLYSHKNAETE